MPAPRKTLEDLVADRSFLARRKHHRQLLEGRLVRDPTLRAIQRAYQEEQSNAEAYLLAQQFERQVRTGEQAPQHEQVAAVEQLVELGHLRGERGLRLVYASLGPGLESTFDQGLARFQQQLVGVSNAKDEVRYAREAALDVLRGLEDARELVEKELDEQGVQ